MRQVTQATFDFIRNHAEDDVRQLALKGAKDPDVNLTFALAQIAGRQKARTKLPRWAATDGIVYPSHLSMEQCSSERTARYKAQVVNEYRLTPAPSKPCVGTFLDLTGGFGVDFAFLSEGFQRAVYVERQEQLCAISSENFRTLGLANAEVVCADGIGYLRHSTHADLIFIDPARRDGHGARTYGIGDCTPNVLELMEELRQKASLLMLKLSPMLDWRKAVADLGGASEVHIVSVDNECKELLILVEGGTRSEEGGRRTRVVCVNLLSDGSEQHFEFAPHPSSLPPPSSFIPLPSSFLFEPNASVMKAGCFALIAERFGVSQPDANSHLFLSDRDVATFPGRRFAIEQTVSLNKRELKAAMAGIDRANIAVRNFPLKAEQLRQKLRLKDGGDTYIFATTVRGKGHQLFICRKIG